MSAGAAGVSVGGRVAGGIVAIISGPVSVLVTAGSGVNSGFSVVGIGAGVSITSGVLVATVVAVAVAVGNGVDVLVDSSVGVKVGVCDG